jgi:hypothetical protein
MKEKRKEEMCDGDFGLICKRLGYIYFRLDEYNTLNIPIEDHLIEEKNYIYRIYSKAGDYAHGYSDLIWRKKYPDWKGQSFGDIIDNVLDGETYESYKYNYDIDLREVSVHSILEKELTIKNIDDWLHTWLNKKEYPKQIIEKHFQEQLNLKSNDFVVESINTMIGKYDLSLDKIKEGLKVLNDKKDRFDNYQDLMRFLAGIYRNISQHNKIIKIGD